MYLPDDDGPEILKKIYWSNTSKSLFNTIFPYIEGHTNKIDDDIKDEKS